MPSPGQERLAAVREDGVRADTTSRDAERRVREAEAALAAEQRRMDTQRDHYAQALEDWQRERAALEKKASARCVSGD